MGFEFIERTKQKPKREDYFKDMKKNSVVYYNTVEIFINAQDEFIEYLEAKIEAVKKAIEK